jgi:ElaB/YqjD/DUF883 family membrane-anchored ribosome-binding protein
MTTHTEETIESGEGGPQRLAEAAGDIAGQATSVVEQRASSTMTQVGDTIDQVARAVRNTGEQLRNDQPQLAGLADTAAEQAEHAAQFLRQHDARDVLDEVQDFARRQPAVIVGAGLALGLLVGRATKSAGPSGPSGYQGARRHSGNGRAAYGTSGYDAGYGASYGAATQFGSRYAAAGAGTVAAETVDDQVTSGTDWTADTRTEQ